MQDPSCDIANDIIGWADIATALPLPDIGPPGAQAPPISDITEADAAAPPYSLAGRFRSSVGKNRRMGTAQIAGRGDILITAAHMLRDKDGSWLSEFAFEPIGGPATVITRARWIGVKSNWARGADALWNWPADYGFLVLEQPISDTFLELEFASTTSRAVCIGFPLDFFGGTRMMKMDGAVARINDFPDQRDGELLGGVVGVDPRFGLGASGGGWFEVEDSGEVSKRLMGVNATLLQGKPINGPILSSCADHLFQEICEL